MNSKIETELKRAEEYFYSWRLVEAYNLLKRYFDRLPFKPDDNHARYIGIFVRTLLELGKEFDLRFYTGELEKLYQRNPEPSIGYQLAVVYSYSAGIFTSGSETKTETVRKLLERILKSPAASEYHAKSKMLLASHYLRQNDLGTCREFIRSIEEPMDPKLRVLLDIWRANLMKEEGKTTEAIEALSQVLKSVTPDTDWYAYFYAKLLLAMAYTDKEDLASAMLIAEEIRTKFNGRHFKTVQIQLKELFTALEHKSDYGVITLSEQLTDHELTYSSKKISLSGKTPAEKLLLLLAKKKFLEKDSIIQSLYKRAYCANRDDRLIYSHIHSLRKKLKSVGLPKDAILTDGSGYRLVPKVRFLRSQL